MTATEEKLLSQIEEAKQIGNNKRVIDLLEELVESQKARIEHLESDLKQTDREFDIHLGAQGVTIHNLTTKVSDLEKELEGFKQGGLVSPGSSRMLIRNLRKQNDA